MKRLAVLALACALLAAAGALAWWHEPGWTRRHVERSDALLRERHADAARAELLAALERHPRDRDVRLRLVQLELALDRREPAYLQLKAYTELFADDADAWRALAGLLEGGGMPDEAVAALDAALDAQPGRADLRLERARLRLRLGRFAGARRDADAVLAAQPADVTARVAQADAVAAIEGAASGARRLAGGIAAPAIRLAQARLLAAAGRSAEASALLGATFDDPRQRRDATLLAARLAVRAGRRDESAQRLDALLRDAPFDPDALALRALVQADAGDAGGALARLDDAGSLAPALRGLRARIESAGADVAAQRVLLRQSVEFSLAAPRAGLPPPPSRIHAGAPVRRGEFVEGHAMLWPGGLAVLRRDADRALAQKDWAAAAEVARRARADYPGTLIGPWLEGVAALAQQQPERAAERFAEGLVYAPRAILLARALGQTWTRQQDASHAAERIAALAQADPGFAAARRLAANTFLDARLPDRAEAALRAALPGASEASAHADLAQFLIELDRAADALAVCDEGLRRFAGDADLRSLHARARLRSGDAAGARDELATLVADAPDRLSDGAALVRLLVADGSAAALARARALAPQIAADAPLDLDVVDAVGWTFVRTGDFARARTWLEAATEAAARRPDLHYHLAVLEAREGHRDAARRALHAALDGGAAFAEQVEARRLMQEVGE